MSKKPVTTQNEHQPAAHQQAASDAIADDVVVLMGTNEGLAGVAGTDPPGYLLARRAIVTDGDSSAVVATRDIRSGRLSVGWCHLCARSYLAYVWAVQELAARA